MSSAGGRPPHRRSRPLAASTRPGRGGGSAARARRSAGRCCLASRRPSRGRWAPAGRPRARRPGRRAARFRAGSLGRRSCARGARAGLRPAPRGRCGGTRAGDRRRGALACGAGGRSLPFGGSGRSLPRGRSGRALARRPALRPDRGSVRSPRGARVTAQPIGGPVQGGRALAACGVPATGGCRRSRACRRRSTPGVDSRRGGRGLDARNCPSHPAVRREHARIFLEARRRGRGRPSRVNRAHPTGTVRPSELTRVDHAAPACPPAAVAPAVPVAVPVPPPRIVRPVWTPGTPERIAHVDAHEDPAPPGAVDAVGPARVPAPAVMCVGEPAAQAIVIEVEVIVPPAAGPAGIVVAPAQVPGLVPAPVGPRAPPVAARVAAAAEIGVDAIGGRARLSGRDRDSERRCQPVRAHVCGVGHPEPDAVEQTVGEIQGELRVRLSARGCRRGRERQQEGAEERTGTHKYLPAEIRSHGCAGARDVPAAISRKWRSSVIIVICRRMGRSALSRLQDSGTRSGGTAGWTRGASSDLPDRRFREMLKASARAAFAGIRRPRALGDPLSGGPGEIPRQLPRRGSPAGGRAISVLVAASRRKTAPPARPPRLAPELPKGRRRCGPSAEPAPEMTTDRASARVHHCTRATTKEE